MPDLLKAKQTILFLYTQKYDETQYFCEKVLQLSLMLDQGGCKIFQISSETYLGYCNREDCRDKNGIIITLVVEDVDGFYGHLLENNVKIIKEPSLTLQYGIYNCFFEDPNGYVFEVQRFLEPFPPHLDTKPLEIR